MNRLAFSIVGVGCSLVPFLFVGVPSSAAATTGKTVVSIEFDDGWANAVNAASILSTFGMDGTFFIISGLTGTPAYMTWDNLHTLANEGEEIAGHTVDHKLLTSLSTVEQQREICDDRDNLISQGFSPTDLAYPDGGYSSSTEAIAKACGYNSARSVGGILYPNTSGLCPQNPGPGEPPSPCPAAETVPPLDAYATRTSGTISSLDTPAQIEALVTQAQNAGGGWVQLVFHQICEGVCAGEGDPTDDDATPETLTAVAAWLKTQSTNNTTVETMQQVIGGAVQPAVPGPAIPPAGTGSQLLQNGNLATNTTGANVPDCYSVGGYGTNTAKFTWSATGGSTGGASETVAVTGYSNGNAGLLVNQDLGSCSPTVTPGQVYTASATYKSTAQVYLQVWYRNSFGAWNYWETQPAPASTSYASVTYTTPAVPAGATALSIGLMLASNGTITLGGYALGTTTVTPPSSTLQNPLLTTSTNGVAACWENGGYGSNTAAYSLLANGPNNGAAEQLVVTNYVNGDEKLVSSQNATCAPTVTVGQAYTIGASYTSTAAANFTVFYETAAGDWDYWTSSPNLPTETAYTAATFTTPAAPSGAIAISFGIALSSNGTLTTGNYSLASGTVATSPTTLQNPLLTTSTNGSAACWENGGYGSNTAAYSLLTSGPNGGAAEQLVVTNYVNGDEKLVVSQSAACAPAVTAGHIYTIGASYKSTAATNFTVFYETAAGDWDYWTSSADLPAETAFTQTNFTLPAAPAGAVAISFGVALSSNGTLTTGNYSLTS